MKKDSASQSQQSSKKIRAYTAYMESPLGFIEIISTQKAIISVKVFDKKGNSNTDIPEVAKECIKQLDEYFAGKRIEFSLPLQQNGTSFQLKVWSQLSGVPYGQTISYKKLATDCQNPKAVRAAGSANGKNQHWIIVPCHRVIAANGSLGGYAGGLWRKEWLLNHERNK